MNEPTTSSPAATPQLPESVSSNAKPSDQTRRPSDATKINTNDEHQSPPSQNAECSSAASYTLTKETPRQSWLSRVTKDTWTCEILSAIVSIAAFGAVIGVLCYYDGRSTPNLPYDVTLNAIISVLSTVAKSTTALSIASVISQDKWVFLQQCKCRFADFQIFDEAAHGPMGVLSMLSPRFLRLAGLGGLITILCLAVDPFFQQVIVYPTRLQPLSQQPFITVANAPSLDGDEWRFMGLCNRELHISNYQSMALCTRCQNITEEVLALNQPFDLNYTEIALESLNRTRTYSYFSRNHTFVVPRGANLTLAFNGSLSAWPQNSSTSGSASISYPLGATWDLNSDSQMGISYWSDRTFANVSGPAIALGYISLAWDADSVNHFTIDEAQECALAYCVQTYSRNITKWTLDTLVLHEDFGNNTDDIWTGTINGSPKRYDQPNSWHIDGPMFSVLAGTKMYNDVFCQTQWGGPDSARSANMSCGDTDADSALDPSIGSVMWRLIGNNNVSITDLVQNMGVAASNFLQSESDDNLNTTTQQSGVMWQYQTYVHVRWAWLAFPGAIPALTIIALVWAILQSKNASVPLWRDSAIPLLYRYQDIECSAASGTMRLPRSNLLSQFECESDDAELELIRDKGEESWILRRLPGPQGGAT